MLSLFALMGLAALAAAVPALPRLPAAALSAATAALLVGVFAFFLGMRPTLAVDSAPLWFLLAVAFVASCAVNGLARQSAMPFVAAVGGVLALCVFWFGTTSAVLHADLYRGLMEVEEVKWTGDIALLAQERVQLVDENRARIRASEVLGSQQGLGSQYGYGTFFLQIVGGRPTWVAPLVNNRLLAKLRGERTPGYVTVDATDARQVTLVTDEPLAVHGPGDSFLNAVDRDLWFGGYADEFRTDYSFEIDDAGDPWWVVTVYEPTVGTDGDKVTGVVAVNAASGERTAYAVADVPAWVDLVQPADIVEANLDSHGSYVHGWWNSFSEGRDVIVPTPGLSIVHMADGTSRWYTGMKAQGSQNGGTSGFALIDTRSGKATVYLTAGITEATARQVIDGIYQADEYTATEPRLYLVDGKATLVSLVVDKGGNVQGIGMVAQETRAIYGRGRDLNEARRAYVSAWRKNAAGSLSTTTDSVSSEFTVARVGFETVDGNTNAVIWSGVAGSQLFVVPLREWRAASVTQPGDRVLIGHAPATEGDIVAQTFRNATTEPKAAATAVPVGMGSPVGGSVTSPASPPPR